MIRTETLAVPVVKGEAQLYNVGAFLWNTDSADNTVSQLAVLRAEVEFDDGRRGTATLRAGQVYEGPMRRVWLYGVAGVAVLDVAYDDRDRLVPIPVRPPEPAPLVDRRVVNGALNMTTTPQVVDFTRPTWAQGLIIHSRLSPNAATIIFDVYPLDSLGAAATQPFFVAATVTQTAGQSVDGVLLMAAPMPGDAGAGLPTGHMPCTMGMVPAGGVRLRFYNRNLDAGASLVLEATWRR